MSTRRMFSKDVIDTDMFLEMPTSTQLLYFHLALRADDDGFIASPKRILRLIGCSEDDLRVLLGKDYLIPFDTGVCVIRHWRVHNYIRNDRYKETIYKEEKSQLSKNQNNEYILDRKRNNFEITVGRPDGIPSDIPTVIPTVSTGKVSIGKSISNNMCTKTSPEKSDSVKPSFLLPCLGGGTFPITPEMVESYESAYPAVNVMLELKKMNAWLISNPKNMKKNVSRFINSWLSRSQDKSGRVDFHGGCDRIRVAKSVLDEEPI
jgi:hypothetical protein